MKISATTVHDVTFTVEAFWDEEGGMGHDVHGGACSALVDAVALLQLARIAHPGIEWVIVGTVKTEVKST